MNSQYTIQELDVDDPFRKTGQSTYNPQTEDYIKNESSF